MSTIVRHKDKKSGKIIVYESTSSYDPVLKQSRPIRKYLGTEDPVTHQFYPSSGKPGRKKKSTSAPPASTSPETVTVTDAPHIDSNDLEAEIQKLRKENEALKAEVAALQGTISAIRSLVEK